MGLLGSMKITGAQKANWCSNGPRSVHSNVYQGPPISSLVFCTLYMAQMGSLGLKELTDALLGSLGQKMFIEGLIRKKRTPVFLLNWGSLGSKRCQ